MSRRYWSWPGMDWQGIGVFGGPWGKRGRFFEHGEVRLAILSLLSESPRHGYDLMKELELRSGGTYKVSAGTMYPTLQQLEDEGLIVSEQKEGRRVYQITDAGRAELEREAETVKGIWERAARWEDWGRWMGPEAFAMAAEPLGNLTKATMRAVKRSGGQRKWVEAIRDILDRAAYDMGELEKRF